MSVRIPAAFRSAHRHVPRRRVNIGSTHRYGVTVPAFRTPWRCACGAEGRSGGASGHRVHVVEAFRAERDGVA